MYFFFIERWFVIDFAGFIMGELSSIIIEVVIDCQCYEFDKNVIEELNGQYFEFEKFWCIVVECVYFFIVK